MSISATLCSLTSSSRRVQVLLTQTSFKHVSKYRDRSRTAWLHCGGVGGVLWDVERTNTEGRREGYVTMESIWWRGEVIEVGIAEGNIIAQIKYDAMFNFEQQVGEVRVFPQHMQIIGDTEMTQLRWRYYESSGDPTYDNSAMDQDRFPEMSGMDAQSVDEATRSRVAAMKKRLEEMVCRFEHMERLVMSERALFSPIDGTRCRSESCSDRLLSLLRHKLALAVQKPLGSYRNRADNQEKTAVFNLGCAGSLRTSVDCTAQEFEQMSRLIRSSYKNAYFRVDGQPFSMCSDSIQASVGVAEIMFDSLSGLCGALGICNESDIMQIARRERLSGKKGGSEEAAVRIAGSFLVENEAEDTTAAILVCRGLHEGISSVEEIGCLIRDNREMDSKTVWYRQPLRTQKMSVSSLLRFVYPNEINSSCNMLYEDSLRVITNGITSFSLRWKALPNPNVKMWTRNSIKRPDFVGNLEVDIPYVLIRGTRGVKETNQLINADHIRSEIQG